MKKIFPIVFSLFTLILPPCIYINAETSLQEEIYNEQLKTSKIKDAFESLPKDTKKSLRLFGVENIDWKSITKINPQNFFKFLINLFKESFPKTAENYIRIIAIILLSSLVHSFANSFSTRAIERTIALVSTICIASILLPNIISLINRSSNIIKSSIGFIAVYIPILSGIMLASGQVIASSSFAFIMMCLSFFISCINSHLLIPILSIMLAIGISSSLCSSINLYYISSAINTFIKWSLGFSMTIFAGLLTLQNLVASAKDSISSKTAKFFISGFVPVVGNALGEAFNTVQGSLKLLKSGVGAFGILALSLIFLPIICETILWSLGIRLCVFISKTFIAPQGLPILSSTSKVLDSIFSILLSSLSILIICTAIVITTGGNAL